MCRQPAIQSRGGERRFPTRATPPGRCVFYLVRTVLSVWIFVCFSLCVQAAKTEPVFVSDNPGKWRRSLRNKWSGTN
jgi:hypothetical protein